MVEPSKLLPTENKSYTAEQQRLLHQVEVIQRDVEMRPFGQPFMRRRSGVDAQTGETVSYRDHKDGKVEVLRDEKGKVLSPEEYTMLKEGWGRTINEQPSDGTWKVNANVGIRTRGDDALDIVLVESKKRVSKKDKEEKRYLWDVIEPRSWEYHITRKGQDASNPDNVLTIPVHSAMGAGLFADIGNAGSSYTFENVTTKNFQPQKLLRNASDIAIDFPHPTGLGVALIVLNRDPFEAFGDKKGIRGGTVTVPKHSLHMASKLHNCKYASINGGGKNWGEIIFAEGASIDDIVYETPKNLNELYAKTPIPKDETLFYEGKDGKLNEKLSTPAVDGTGIIPEGANVVMSGNTGTGPNLTVDGKSVKVPPHGFSRETREAWSAKPVWLHGPGSKGTIDLSGLDGRIVISGGGTIKTTQKPVKQWWYTDVILSGGTEDKKAVYTIEVPKFKDPKLELEWSAKEGSNRDYRLERYPMPPYENVPLKYPDGKTVPQSKTENDHISIRGDNIEVWVKEGKEERKIYDSEEPELNQQSGVFKPNGLKLGAATLIAMASDSEAVNAPQTRRQFLGTTAAGTIAAIIGSKANSASQKGLSLQESTVKGLDPITASIEDMVPGIQLARDSHVARVNKESDRSIKIS